MDKQTRKERLTYMLKHVRLEKSILELTENNILNQLQKLKRVHDRHCYNCDETWIDAKYSTAGCPFCKSHHVLPTP